ncbi:MAG: hypothetical protein Ct9H90mP2_09210 [Dehalococcoidia bacterium]|nr:MAG: hypothetical protein Ct9H90mP2_09210 [Dehalococcoidia bacterium]
MNNFGYYILILGFILSTYSGIMFIFGSYKDNKVFIKSATRGFYLSLIKDIYLICDINFIIFVK